MWKDKGKATTQLRHAHPEAVRLAAGHSIGQYELWKAYSKEDQNACSAYLRLQGERRHLNAACQRARNCDRHWSWFELEDWRLTEYGAHLMAAISTRHSEAHSAALRAFHEAKDAERASIPVDDAAWAKEVERRRHDEHWRNDPEWLSHPDNPDRLRPENIKPMDKI